MTSLLRAEVTVPIAGFRLRDDHLMSGPRDRARDPKPDDARTDDKHLHCDRSEMNER